MNIVLNLIPKLYIKIMISEKNKIAFTELFTGVSQTIPKDFPSEAHHYIDLVKDCFHSKMNPFSKTPYNPELEPWRLIETTVLHPFAIRVFEEVVKIPRGATKTYGDLALEINSGSRAVGNTLARNHFPILFPCHRILPKAGGIGFFLAGTQVKKMLLDSEMNT